MTLIKNDKLFRQLIDFSGIKNGAIYPSDIDAVLEFDNKALILMEIKKKGSNILTGQRLLLERICDSWHNPIKSTVLKIVHEQIDTTLPISLKDCFVEKVYYNKKWTKIDKSKDSSVISILNRIGIKWEVEKLKINI